MSTQLPPLETRPKGPRRQLQKIWADMDLRDQLIALLEREVGTTGAWSANIHINARESGTCEVYLDNVHKSSRSEKRSTCPIDTV